MWINYDVAIYSFSFVELLLIYNISHFHGLGTLYASQE